MMRGRVELMPDVALGKEVPAVREVISRRLRWRERGKRWPDEPVATPSGCTIWLTHRRGRHRRTPADAEKAGASSRLGRGASVTSHREVYEPETCAVGDGGKTRQEDSSGGAAAPPRLPWREAGTVGAAMEGPLSSPPAGNGAAAAEAVVASTAAAPTVVATNLAAHASARRSCDEVTSISAARSRREPLRAMGKASDHTVGCCAAADTPARAQAEPPCAESPAGSEASVEGRGRSSERPPRVDLPSAWWPPAHDIAAEPVKLRVASVLCPASTPCAPESAEAGEKEARDDAQCPRMPPDDTASGAAAAVGQGRGASGASAGTFEAPGFPAPSYSFSRCGSREKRCELLLLPGLERAARSSDDFRRVACCHPSWAKKAAASSGSGEGRRREGAREGKRLRAALAAVSETGASRGQGDARLKKKVDTGGGG